MRVRYQESIEYKALKRLKGIRGSVVLRQDFEDLGSYRQISRVFKVLLDENKLVKIGAGVYAKAYLSDVLNIPLIQGGFDQACKEALTKKGIQWELSTAAQARSVETHHIGVVVIHTEVMKSSCRSNIEI